MKKLLLALAACGMISASAMADCCDYDYQDCGCCYDCDADGVYVGALGGLNFLDFRKLEGIKLETDAGWMLGGVVGYKFCNNVRVEAELAYRRNALDQLRSQGVGVDVKGHTSTTTVMANVLYDIDLGYCLTPYVGAGIGYAHNFAKVNGNQFIAGSRGSHNHFAAQAIAGVAYRIAPKTDLGLEYRYLYPAKRTHDQSVALSIRQYF